VAVGWKVYGVTQNDLEVGWVWIPPTYAASQNNVIAQATIGNYSERVTYRNPGNYMEAPGVGPNFFPRHYFLVHNDVHPKPVHYMVTYLSLP
jgi:hypothetical protein